MRLLGLPDDLLLRIALELDFEERLRLSEVCSRLRALCSGPSLLWRDVAATLVVPPPLEGEGTKELTTLAQFHRCLLASLWGRGRRVQATCSLAAFAAG